MLKFISKGDVSKVVSEGKKFLVFEMKIKTDWLNG